MSFIGTKGITELLASGHVITPFNPDCIKNGSYELSLGDQVFLTDSTPRKIRSLKDGDKIEVKPGQFALLMTHEVVNIPKESIAFISIKAGVKFKGLVNVSGFHVDPGFHGKLLFSVYNAGPSNIILSKGTPYFPIWFANLTESQEYTGQHKNQSRIPDEPVEALSQGVLASPNALSKRIDKVDDLKRKIEWVALAILALVIAASVKIWTDKNRLEDAIDYGYNRKKQEIRFDSLRTGQDNKLQKLSRKVDSLTEALKVKPQRKK